jgi:hypothetical protein
MSSFRYPCLVTTSPLLSTLPSAVLQRHSGIADSLDVTGGVYKTRERIHRNVSDLRLLAIPAS